MDEEIESNCLKVESPLLKRNFSWVDLAIILGGIIGIYVCLSLGTLWLTKRWPYERILMYLNAFMTQFSFFLLIWAWKKIRHWQWSDFGWHIVSIKKVWIKVLQVYSLTWVFNISYAFFLYFHGLTPPSTDVYTKLLGHTTWYTFILNLLLAGVLAPLVEETLFRGIIFGSLQAYFGKWTAAMVSAAIFSGLHFQAYGFIPRFMLGIALVYLYDKYKSLYPSVGLHALNNTVATIIAANLQL